MPTGEHLRLRLFMEGIEVPVISAVLSIQPNAPAQCQIQIPATDRSHEFLPRTLVHCFFYDLYDGPDDLVSIVGVGEEDQVNTREDEINAAEEAREESRESTEEARAEATGEEPAITDDGNGGYRIPPTAGFAPNPFEDEPDEENPAVMPADSGDESAGPAASAEGPADLDFTHLEDRRWKCFFVGEVIGYQFAKSIQSRSVVLSCLDNSVYWDTCYQYKVNVASLTGNGLAHFVGAGTSLFDVFFQSSTSTIVDVLNRNSRSRPELTGLLSGVVHLLERVGGVYRGRGFRGVNDFYSIAELRLHLIDQITASESDDSSRRLCARRAYNRWMRREGGQIGKIASFREILNMVNKFIFHDVYPNPIAKYEPAEERSRLRTRVSRVELGNSPQGRRLRSRIEGLGRLAQRTRGRFNALREIGEAHARVVRGRRSLGLMGETEFSSAREAQEAGLTVMAQIETNLAELERGCRQAQSMARSQGIAGGVPLNLGLASRTTGLALRFFRAGEITTPRNSLERVIGILNSVLTGIGSQTITRRRTIEETISYGPRLNTQIIRPDIWMVSPPRCNIIFPELYNNVSFSRQYMREVTRMRLTTTDEIFGPDELLNQWYFAPDVEVLGARQRRQARGDVSEGRTLRQAAHARRLMDHELYTGVIPVFERMNEVNIYAARTNQVVHRGARVPYVTRAAHFQFFKHRFTPRTMSVSGKFNPYAVAGFPALVMDRYMDRAQVDATAVRGLNDRRAMSFRDEQDALDEQEGVMDFTPEESPDPWIILRENAPTQMVGMIVGMTHSINQQAASTSYNMQYARTHRENDELLGANRVRLSRRESGNAEITRTVAAIDGDPPRVGQMGPNYGVITSVERVNRTGTFMLFGTFGGDQPRRRRTEVSVGTRAEARTFGPEVVTLVGDPRREVSFSPYEISETVERYRGQEVDVPFEDFVRPPWMSDVWKNDRVGSVYQQFFGTGAITDDIIIDTTGRERVSGATPNLEAPVQDADGRARRDTVGVEGDWYQPDGAVAIESEMGVNVERAIDLVVRAYSTIKVEGLDVREFVRAYTWRPVADMVDILGTRDLQINAETGEKTRGTEGFHSRAFGHGPTGQNLRNIVGPTARRILGLDTDPERDRSNTLSRLDKRTEKSERVFDYVTDLWRDRGQLG